MEEHDQFIFVDNDVETLSGNLFCPYMRAGALSKNKVSLLYNIDLDSAIAEYSRYYVKTTEGTYQWLGHKIRRYQQNDLPLKSVSGIEDGSRVRVIFRPTWSRLSIFELCKTKILNSQIFVVSRSKDETYEQWKAKCERQIPSVTNSRQVNAVYVTG